MQGISHIPCATQGVLRLMFGVQDLCTIHVNCKWDDVFTFRVHFKGTLENLCATLQHMAFRLDIPTPSRYPDRHQYSLFHVYSLFVYGGCRPLLTSVGSSNGSVDIFIFLEDVNAPTPPLQGLGTSALIREIKARPVPLIVVRPPCTTKELHVPMDLSVGTGCPSIVPTVATQTDTLGVPTVVRHPRRHEATVSAKVFYQSALKRLHTRITDLELALTSRTGVDNAAPRGSTTRVWTCTINGCGA